jgi:diguanylate cyclase (GGDEF)-like protein/PAS domain S-box-containing protein
MISGGFFGEGPSVTEKICRSFLMGILSSEQRLMLQQVFTNLSVAAFAIDSDHKVILWNKACEELTGLMADEVIGTRDHWKGFYKEPRSCLADTLLADGLEGALKIYPHVSASEAVDGGLHAENWCLDQRGEKLYLLFEAGMIRDVDGNFLAVVETLRDTTQPKLLNDIQRAVSSITDFSISSESIEELLSNTLELVHASPWMTVEDKGTIHLVDRDNPDQLMLAASKGLTPYLEGVCQVVQLGSCVCGRAAESGEILVTDSDDEQHDVQYDGMAPHSHFCVPIKSQGKVLGVLNTYTPINHNISPGERAFLENVTQALANGIERWRSDRAVLEAKATFSKAEQITKMGSWNWMLKENRLRFSDGSLRLLGLPPETGEIDIEDCLNLFPISVRANMKAMLGGNALKEPEAVEYSLEHVVIRPDGSERVVQAMGEVIKNRQGQFIQVVGAIRDITQRKRAEEATKLLGRVLGGSMNSIFIFDSRSHKFIQVSEGARKSLGYTSEELSVMTLTDLTPDFDKDELSNYLRALINQEQERVVFETVIYNKLGESSPVEVRLQLSQGEKPSVFVAVTTSIGKRLEEQKRLQNLAHYDVLTGLPNRMLFNERLEQAISHGVRKKSTVALMFMDLDKFKAVNDTMGHDIGDLLLKEASTRILGCLRDNDTVARLGGDEFTVILQDFATPEEPTIVAKKIVELMQTPFELAGQVANIEPFTLSATY